MFFSFKKQHLFKYWDGSKTQRVDPVKVHQELFRIDGFDPAETPVAAEGFEPDGAMPLFADIIAKAVLGLPMNK